MPHRNLALNATGVTLKLELDELTAVLDAVRYVYPDKPQLIAYLENRRLSAAKLVTRRLKGGSGAEPVEA